MHEEDDRDHVSGEQEAQGSHTVKYELDMSAL